jgi:hypothetical protein
MRPARSLGPCLQAIALVRKREPAVEDALGSVDADQEQLVEFIARVRARRNRGPLVLSDFRVIVYEHERETLREGLMQAPCLAPAIANSLLDGESELAKEQQSASWPLLRYCGAAARVGWRVPCRVTAGVAVKHGAGCLELRQHLFEPVIQRPGDVRRDELVVDPAWRRIGVRRSREFSL